MIDMTRMDRVPKGYVEFTDTTTTTVATLIPEQWAKRVELTAQPLQHFRLMTGPEEGMMPIVEKTDLDGEPGSKVNVNKLGNLSTSSPSYIIAETDDLEGSEQALSLSEVEITPAEWGTRVRYTKSADEDVTDSLRTKAMLALGNWVAQVEDLAAYTAAAAGSSVIWGGDATSVGDMDVTDVLSLTTLNKAKAKLAADNAPIVMPNGVYVCIMNTFQSYDLFSSSAWQTAVRDGQVRGDTNPLFTGSLGIWNGIALYETNNVTRTQSATSAANYYSSAIMFGARAMAKVTKRNWMWKEYEKPDGRRFAIYVSARKAYKIINSTHLVELTTSAVDPNA